MKWAAAAVVLLAAVTGALLLAGKGDEPRKAAAASAPVRLAWKGDPQLIRVPELPRDGIVSGRVRNASLRPVELAVDRIQVVDADGRRLRTSARFLEGFAHGLYPASMDVKGSKFERTRLGQLATIKPGQDLPLTVSWRVPSGRSEPVEVRFGGGSLSLPR